jgi:hypothetical protein
VALAMLFNYQRGSPPAASGPPGLHARQWPGRGGLHG